MGLQWHAAAMAEEVMVVVTAVAMSVVMAAWALGLLSLLRSTGWAINPTRIIPTPTPIPTLLTPIRGQRCHRMADTWSRAFLRRAHHRHRHRRSPKATGTSAPPRMPIILT